MEASTVVGRGGGGARACSMSDIRRDTGERKARVRNKWEAIK